MHRHGYLKRSSEGKEGPATLLRKSKKTLLAGHMQQWRALYVGTITHKEFACVHSRLPFCQQPPSRPATVQSRSAVGSRQHAHRFKHTQSRMYALCYLCLLLLLPVPAQPIRIHSLQVEKLRCSERFAHCRRSLSGLRIHRQRALVA